MPSKPLRERGTLKHTLPRRPIILVLLVGIASATLAAQLAVYSLPSDDERRALWWMYFGIAALGSVETLVGILMGDSNSQSFVMGVVLIILGVGLSNVHASFNAAAPVLAFSAVASIKSTQSAIASFATILYLPIVLQSIIAIKSISFLFNTLISSSEPSEFSMLPSFTVTIITLLLMHSYMKNRSHKNGLLLTSQMQSQSILSVACITLSSIMTCRSFPLEGVVFLLGSLFTILITTFFASVADVWYAVGSGQFQMVSLDTAGMMAYFILPVMVLYFRFLERYGERIGENIATLVDRGLILVGMSGLEGSGNKDNLVLILSITTAVGVPLLSALCPMGGYLFSRAYTHGQPNTKKVALCVKLSDLAKEDTDLWKSLEETKSVLNILVTLEDLQSRQNDLKKLAKKGHHIAIASNENSGSFTRLNLFQGSSALNNIEKTFDEYSQVLGQTASWAFSTSLFGRHPAYLRKAHDLGMKVAYWSTLLQLDGVKLSEEQKRLIVGDVIHKNGGSIIYVTASEGSVSTALKNIVGGLGDFTIEALPDVVREDATMTL